MPKYLSIMALLAIGTLYFLGMTNQDAMEKCQQNHSYDTCAYALR